VGLLIASARAQNSVRQDDLEKSLHVVSWNSIVASIGMAGNTKKMIRDKYIQKAKHCGLTLMDMQFMFPDMYALAFFVCMFGCLRGLCTVCSCELLPVSSPNVECSLRAVQAACNHETS
jgi:hypothetical protein